MISQTNCRYFKPAVSALERLGGRHRGWRLLPGTYFLIPYSAAAGQDGGSEPLKSLYRTPIAN